ncbi:SagB family peptide dehydrogenase [Cupriavidus consociatus]|uniref:SagB family peptide dehydrogenase n=1 Tax=Cupriavidus consociatus TaxID=2821357 RepID=UPI001AE5E6AA|nr:MULTISPECIES: SagB family peptide dehydrogenase [unclassified Cupriavidus]MBP0619147.1 SagB family peptide dehydrogenase [Cupriavidus sp. LEh25]MDK2655792.1 SagB family peptide dehydrogenase [Cupriavidus sp. LEh21]
MNLHINPNIFLIFTQDGVVLWDFERHHQYALAPDYASRLLEIAYNGSTLATDTRIDSELQRNNIVANHVFGQHDWGWDILARIFHVGTKDIPQNSTPTTARQWAMNHAALCVDTLNREIPPYRTQFACPTISLPAPDLSTVDSKSLWQSLLERRTCREFRQESVNRETLSTILYSTFGFLSEREEGINKYVPKYLRQRRSSPSGGGLNSTEVYIWALRIDGLRPGTYHYSPATHSLMLINEIPDPDVLPAVLMGQYFSSGLAFGAFIASRFDRMWWKYGHSRAYRVSLLDIGHLSQTFQLTSTACGLKTWISAAFKDSDIERLLDIKSLSEQVLLFVGAGYSNGEDLDAASRQVLAEYSTSSTDET